MADVKKIQIGPVSSLTGERIDEPTPRPSPRPTITVALEDAPATDTLAAILRIQNQKQTHAEDTLADAKETLAPAVARVQAVAAATQEAMQTPEYKTLLAHVGGLDDVKLRSRGGNPDKVATLRRAVDQLRGFGNSHAWNLLQRMDVTADALRGHPQLVGALIEEAEALNIDPAKVLRDLVATVEFALEQVLKSLKQNDVPVVTHTIRPDFEDAPMPKAQGAFCGHCGKVPERCECA